MIKYKATRGVVVSDHADALKSTQNLARASLRHYLVNTVPITLALLYW